jgi:hypothetical protein
MGAFWATREALAMAAVRARLPRATDRKLPRRPGHRLACAGQNLKREAYRIAS